MQLKQGDTLVHCLENVKASQVYISDDFFWKLTCVENLLPSSLTRWRLCFGGQLMEYVVDFMDEISSSGIHTSWEPLVLTLKRHFYEAKNLDFQYRYLNHRTSNLLRLKTNA